MAPWGWIPTWSETCRGNKNFRYTFNVFLINTEMCMSWLLLILKVLISAVLLIMYLIRPLYQTPVNNRPPRITMKTHSLHATWFFIRRPVSGRKSVRSWKWNSTFPRLRLTLCTTSFNRQKFCVLPTMHLCVLRWYQNKQRLFLFTALTYRFL